MPESSGPNNQTFPKSARIRSQRTFKIAFADRCRAADQWMSVFAVASGLQSTRLGISVGRAYGPVVRRNRIKRLVREAFRRIRHELPAGIDLIVVPRRGGNEPSIRDLQASLCLLAGRVHAKLEKGAPDSRQSRDGRRGRARQ